MLKEFARRLPACVHGSDTVARRGGDELIEAADRTLYKAKAAGRDRFVVAA